MKTAASSQSHAAASAGGSGANALAAQPAGERISTDETAKPFRETRYGWLVLAVVWLACAAYAGIHLREGWQPLDAGALGETAARVLRGQVPHRDFIEVYTGGLSYLNAFAFRLFGVNSFSLRIPLFLFFLAWVPAVYRIARRFAVPLAAGVVTLLAVAWSVPNYMEAMPSWYNLFFATWGVLALLRYTEEERRRWLWLAGLCGGLSFLFKITGLYFVAAALLFFVFREHSLSRASPETPSRARWLYKLFVTGGLALFLLLLASVVSERPTAGDYFQFFLPTACLVALLLWREWRLPAGAVAPRFRRLFSMALPFAVAVAAPVVLFLLWYAHEGALRAWYQGTFGRASLHALWAGRDAVGPLGLLALVPVLLVAALAFDSSPSVRRFNRYGAPLLLAGLLVAAWKSAAAYIFLSYSLSLLIPLVAVAALFALRGSTDASPATRQKIFLVVVAAVTWGLIQFPLPGATYFAYVAPLLVLALLALHPRSKKCDVVAMGSLLAFYMAFALFLHTPAFRVAVGVGPRQPIHLRPIELARAGGIRAPERLAKQYEDLVPVMRAHARGPYIYCTPGCPQIYFLSGKLNPTGSINDFLDPDYMDVPYRTERILETLQTHRVNVVALGNWKLMLSGEIPPALRRALDERYPKSQTIGEVEVRWKP